MQQKKNKSLDVPYKSIHSNMVWFDKEKMIPKIVEYINSHDYPTIKGLCVYLNIGQHHIDKAREVKGNEALVRLIDLLKSKQEDYLIQAGLQNRINPIFAIFLLKANHGYIETSRVDMQVKSINIQIKDFTPTKTKGYTSDMAQLI